MLIIFSYIFSGINILKEIVFAIEPDFVLGMEESFDF